MPPTPQTESKIGDGHLPDVQRKDVPKDFTWSSEPEPHAVRRREILKKYPQIKELYKADPLSAVFGAVTVFLQCLMIYLSPSMSWPVLIFSSYFIGGFLIHSIVLGIHELSHDLWFDLKWKNMWFGYFMNVPLFFPFYRTFKRYHLDHHAFQGSDTKDTDIPSVHEGVYVTGKFLKFLFVCFSWLPYTFRPVLTYPKPIIAQEVYNLLINVAVDVFVLMTLGWKAWAYMVLCLVLGLGPHPMSGHFIAEHFEMVKGQETYSYYGPLNYLTYNVGYHNEHHDFPRVPGRFLPKIKEIAPEYYDMPSYSSWVKVMRDFVMYDHVNCFYRVKRP